LLRYRSKTAKIQSTVELVRCHFCQEGAIFVWDDWGSGGKVSVVVSACNCFGFKA